MGSRRRDLNPARSGLLDGILGSGCRHGESGHGSANPQNGEKNSRLTAKARGHGAENLGWTQYRCSCFQPKLVKEWITTRRLS
jgi:hypothetical protein